MVVLARIAVHLFLKESDEIISRAFRRELMTIADCLCRQRGSKP